MKGGSFIYPKLQINNTAIKREETIRFLGVLLDENLKLHGQLRKTVLSLTPQAMYNQFKRPSSAGSVRELYYIERLKTFIKRMAT